MSTKEYIELFNMLKELFGRIEIIELRLSALEKEYNMEYLYNIISGNKNESNE